MNVNDEAKNGNTETGGDCDGGKNCKNQGPTTNDSMHDNNMQRSSPDRILFGSCNSQLHPQTLWPNMASRNATAFVWAGDAVYADDFEKRTSSSSWSFLPPLPWPLKHRDATAAEHAALLKAQLEHPGYQEFVNGGGTSNNKMVVLGSLDDHDYGANNGDVTYQHRRETGLNYVQFLEAADQDREKKFNEDSGDDPWKLWKWRAREGRGVYGVQALDFSRPKGQERLSDREAGIDIDYAIGNTDNASATTIQAPTPLSNKSVAIFILDVRSNKTPWKSGAFNKYFVDYEADFLGEHQWEWFSRSLARSTATVNLIVQGLQVHPDRFVDGNLVEDWSRFPSAQHRLYQTILKQKNLKAPILVSGDVHMAELLRKDCWQNMKSGSDNRESTLPSSSQHQRRRRMLLEVTSSGMTHSWGTHICARPYNVACNIRYIGYCMSMAMHFAHYTGAWTELVDVPPMATKVPSSSRSASSAKSSSGDVKRPVVTVEPGAPTGIQYSLELNFGEFEFDWEKRQVIIRIHGDGTTTNRPYLSTRWDFEDLSGYIEDELEWTPSAQHSARVLDPLIRHGKASHDDYTCVAYRGPQSWQLKAIGICLPGFLTCALLTFPLLLLLLMCVGVLQRRRRRSCFSYHNHHHGSMKLD